MDFIPPQVAYAAAKLDSYSTNKFRLETSGQTSASEGSVVTISLPESTLCMLPSFRVHFDATTTSSTVSGKTVYGKLPNASDLVSNIECFVGGVQVMGNASEFNTCARIYNYPNTTLDRELSVDSLLRNELMQSAGDAVQTDVPMVYTPPIGFFTECATKILHTGLTGPVTIRLTFAPRSVLGEKYRDHGRRFHPCGCENCGRQRHVQCQWHPSHHRLREHAGRL